MHPDWPEIERKYRDRIDECQVRYELAKAAVGRARKDWLSVPAADGLFGYRKALIAESRALAEYCEVLREFADAVVRYNPPKGGA